MSLNAERLMALGIAYPLSNELKSQVDTDVTAQRDIHTIDSAVAATGANLAGAYATTTDIVHVKSVHAGVNEGIALRAATSVKTFQTVINVSGGTLKVYPPSSSGKIDAQAAGGSVSLSNTQTARFIAVNTTNGEYFGMY